MNKSKPLFINKRIFYLILIIILETIFVKAVQFKILPEKYFYDSTRILALSNGLIDITDKSFSFTGDFFSFINIFGFTTLAQWSYFLSFISIILIIFVLAKNKKISLKNFAFVIASVGLLNIYVFNISKDLIQFLLFYLVFIILSNEKISNQRKLFLSCLILLMEAIEFRVYYLIMAMVMVTIYFIYEKKIKNKKINKKTVKKILLIALILFFMEIFVVQLVSTNNYNSIINARYITNINRESSPDSITIINDLLGRNTDFIKFVLNYLINFIRMLFPVELITKGVKYIPFIFYQLFITFTLFKTSTKLNDRNIMWLITFVSFIMISVIFEPDFGSFIRHESALFLIMFEMNKIIDEQRKET